MFKGYLMGFLSDNELLHGDSDDTFGILDDVRPVRLTQVVYSQGEWRFGEEVEALHERTGRMEIWYNGSGQPVNARWWQESVRVQPRARLGSGAADLVVTRWPWTQFQVDIARFRPGSAKEKTRRPDLARERFADEDQFFRWLDKLPQDYWLTTSKAAVARINRPTPRQFDTNHRHSARITDNPGLVFGVCMGQSQSVDEELLAHWKSKELLRQADLDQLLFWFAGHQQTGTAPIEARPQLLPDTKDAARALLIHCIRMSLAGPEKDVDQWIGRPVVELTMRLFREVLNAVNRREASVRKQERPIVAFRSAK